MTDFSYLQRRIEIETYFDRTAMEAWKRLTSDAPVGRIRATVRAGRDQMRATLLDWLPGDLTGARVLDAGCGTGALAVAAAERGADVVAIDLAPNLVQLARERAPASYGTAAGRIEFRSGDMLDPALGNFDFVVSMDSLIHYQTRDVVEVLNQITRRTRHAVLFTYAPRTPLLATMHAIGRFFPKSDRAPSIEPVATRQLLGLIASNRQLDQWHAGRTQRVARGFYTSQALELVRK